MLKCEFEHGQTTKIIGKRILLENTGEGYRRLLVVTLLIVIFHLFVHFERHIKSLNSKNDFQRSFSLVYLNIFIIKR